jgi:hypothetical protein
MSSFTLEQNLYNYTKEELFSSDIKAEREQFFALKGLNPQRMTLSQKITWFLRDQYFWHGYIPSFGETLYFLNTVKDTPNDSYFPSVFVEVWKMALDVHNDTSNLQDPGNGRFSWMYQCKDRLGATQPFPPTVGDIFRRYCAQYSYLYIDNDRNLLERFISEMRHFSDRMDDS